jgi:hypothetical protein
MSNLENVSDNERIKTAKTEGYYEGYYEGFVAGQLMANKYYFIPSETSSSPKIHNYINDASFNELYKYGVYNHKYAGASNSSGIIFPLHDGSYYQPTLQDKRIFFNNNKHKEVVVGTTINETV